MTMTSPTKISPPHPLSTTLPTTATLFYLWDGTPAGLWSVSASVHQRLGPMVNYIIAIDGRSLDPKGKAALPVFRTDSRLILTPDGGIAEFGSLGGGWESTHADESKSWNGHRWRLAAFGKSGLTHDVRTTFASAIKPENGVSIGLALFTALETSAQEYVDRTIPEAERGIEAAVSRSLTDEEREWAIKVTQHGLVKSRGRLTTIRQHLSLAAPWRQAHDATVTAPDPNAVADAIAAHEAAKAAAEASREDRETRAAERAALREAAAARKARVEGAAEALLAALEGMLMEFNIVVPSLDSQRDALIAARAAVVMARGW